MPKFEIVETIHSEKVKTVRLGATGAGNQYDDKEVGKAVKLSASNAYVLCVAGDPIEGIVSSLNSGLYDGFSIGGIVSDGYKSVVFDGLQATPGTGVVAVGDFVVTGTVVAKGTALSAALRVTKATMQPGVTEAAVVGDVNDMLKVAMHACRVVSLGAAGTGAVGTTGVVEFI